MMLIDAGFYGYFLKKNYEKSCFSNITYVLKEFIFPDQGTIYKNQVFHKFALLIDGKCTRFLNYLFKNKEMSILKICL